jgi:hypothetical protein
VISLRNALPICAMPNGTFWRIALLHVQEVHEDALRRLPDADTRWTRFSSSGPMYVLNIRLKLRASVS